MELQGEKGRKKVMNDIIMLCYFKEEDLGS